MRFQKKMLICFLVMNLSFFFCDILAENVEVIQADEIVKANRLAELLAQPNCLKSFDRTVQSYEIVEVKIPSDNIILDGKFYCPSDSDKYPAVIFMHGGGNDAELLVSGPMFYASRLAHCGIAALIYYKRGTGKSGGLFHESSFDDFINDAGFAARFLIGRKEIDTTRIGVFGGSEGGRLAPVAAVRFQEISFVICNSGPFGSVVEQANFNIEYALGLRGYSDSVIENVMPLWKRHHASWGSQDPQEKKAVAAEIIRYRENYDMFAIPSTEQEILTDSGLFFLRPQFNSMSKDYISELSKLSVPLLALFGELDPIIDVPASVRNLEEQMIIGGHADYEIFVIDSVSHSFDNPETGEFLHDENIILNWLDEKLFLQ